MSSVPPSSKAALIRIASQTCAVALALGTASSLPAQTPNAKPAGTTPAAQTSPQQNNGEQPDRASAYYHYMLAHQYEDMANTYGRPEYATRAIEEYKLALDADPTSKYLTSGLAELYFRTGRVRDAVLAAQEQIKKDPNNLDAHKLLGSIYLRSLGDGQQQPSGSAQEDVLKLAIGEYEKIVALEPNNVQNRLMLGQLYSFAHDSAHAEEQFSAAEKIDPGSEDTALSLARLYTEQGDPARAIKILGNLPEDDKTAKTEFVLGASYERLKDTQHAIDAYKKSLDLEPDNLDTERALARVLLNDNQLTPALAAYQDIAAGDPTDPEAYLRISEIQRRQGSYEEALATLKKAKSLVSDSLEVSFNEGLIDDALGRYDDAVAIFQKLVADSDHSSGQYSESEKSNRALFLERLAILYREQNKIDQAIAAYQKMADLGGEYTNHAYESEVEAYRDAHQYDKSLQVAREASEKLPKDRGVKLMYAMQLTDGPNPEEGINLAKGMLAKTAADLEVYRQLANIYTRLRRWQDASDAIDHADQLSSKPDDKFYVAFLRGALYERQKLYDQAEVEFRNALALDPNNSMTLNYLGYMLADHGMKLQEALTMIKKAVELDPQNYAYLDSLGWVYFKLGQYNLAETDLRKAVERNSTDATVHDHLGELYEKTGRLKLAAAQWEESLNEYAKTMAADMDPGDEGRVQKKLDSVRVRIAREGPVAQPKP
ncbi:MAG: tetratricopeptide repeat protein [Silvibacterium sp.]|nr:tetratricopeptide repeat protein [Silvibacterium sp.]